MAREIVTSENKDDYDRKKRGFKLVHIPLEHIEHGESVMPGGKLTWPGAKDLIKKYASMKTPLPAIDVVSNDEDEGRDKRWMIADGSHRFEAAKLRGMKHISAYVSPHDKEGQQYIKEYKKI